MFEWDDEQRLLRNSVDAWLGRQYDQRTWREVAVSQAGAPTFWRDFAQMGWLAAPLPEQHGGFGGGLATACMLGESFGRALVLEPYLSSIVLGAGLFCEAGTAAQKSEFIPRIARGELLLALAQAEPTAGFDLSDVRTRACRDAHGWSITGEKIAVWDAPSADALIVVARSCGARFDRGGIGLFLIPRESSGVELRPYRLLDNRRGARVIFEQARAQCVLGDVENGFPALSAVIDQALAFLSAEACGAMEATLKLTEAYLAQRKQFQQALSENQVLRHRIVDLRIQLECSRSLALHAAHAGHGCGASLAAAAASAKVQCGRAGRRIGQEAVQLHGAMGMTDELAIGHYLKRLIVLDTQYGNADHHQQRAMRRYAQGAAAS